MTFDGLLGNPQVKHILDRYIRNQMIPTSMIFAGPESSNKLAYALAFAKALNCLKDGGESEEEAAPPCRCCLSIDRNLFPDVRILEPEGQFYRKQQIDELIESSRRRPMQGRMKVMILKDSQQMNDSSANAFLKTLEEPSPSNVFILLTSKLDLLLPTIRSRCQLLKFVPLSQVEARSALKRRGFDPEKARIISFFTRNNVESISGSDWEELEAKRLAVFDVFSRLINRTGIEDVLLDLDGRGRNRETFIAHFRDLINLISIFLRDIMVLMIEPESGSVVNFDFKDRLVGLLKSADRDQIFFLLKKMELLLRDIHRNLNSRVLILEFINSFMAGEEENV
jgi:DNA polymerase-3 subunit delta'